MLLPNPPALKLRIKPMPGTGSALSHLCVTYTLDPPTYSPRHFAQPFRLLYQTFRDNVPAHQYSPDDIQASDAAGPLPLVFLPRSGQDNLQEWRPVEGRQVNGAVTLRMTVWPRKVDISTPLGARIDLRKDQGGLQGAGCWFLPKLDSLQQLVFANTVSWDLSDCSLGTRAIWSYGEGPAPITKMGPVDTLLNTVYMTGFVQSHPPGPWPGISPGFCGIYWFESIPNKLLQLCNFNEEMYARMAQMFEEESGSYRVFIRRSIRGYGGTGFSASYMLEYDDSVEKEEDVDAIRQVFAHEMVHSFALIDAEENGDDNSWYIEGIAEFFSCILPYRFGILPATYATRCINRKLSAYGTNPAINMPLRDAERNFFSSWYAGSIPYHRGMAYLLLVDAQLRSAARITIATEPGPLDEISVGFTKRRRRGEKILQADWLHALGQKLDDAGIDFRNQFQNMLSGVTIPLEDVFVGSSTNKLIAGRQRILQYGFDKAALSTRIIGEIEPGSGAEAAGLRIGDHIKENMPAGIVVEDSQREYWLVVERDDEDEAKEIKWLPREERTARVWQVSTQL
ncbi:peptidase M61 domain-containing protein [Trichoderma austrokoningii]